MKTFTLALTLFTLTGCASLGEVGRAISLTPQRTQEALSDPIRRVHLTTQIGRLVSTAGVGITCAMLLSPTIIGMMVCPFVAVAFDYLTYEYVLEPISKVRVREGKASLVDAYWEGGPRHDEGEKFTAP